MNKASPAMEVRLDSSYEEALDKVADALKEQGFGVLTRIDVQSTLKEKIDVDFRKYSILGACNPKLAHRALDAHADVGLMLPCNVTVEESDGGTLVRIADPGVMMSMGGFEDDPRIAEVAGEARRLLGQAAATLSAGSNS